MASLGEKFQFSQLKKLSTSHQIKLLCLVVILFYCLAAFNLDIFQFLVCTPYYLKPPHLRIWTLVTSGLVETRLLLVFVDVTCLLATATVLEPIWGVSELFMFISIVSIVPVSILLILLFIMGLVWESFALNLDIYGGAGVLCGLAVALKQVRPDFDMSLVPPVSVRFKHLPFLCILVYLVLGGFDLIQPICVLLSVTGLVVSWSYLRFFQRRDSDLRGDQTDTFEFVTLFPEILHPCLNKFGAGVGSFLHFVRLSPTPQRTYDLGVPSDIELLLPTQNPSTNTDRRKLKAQKDLEERLSRTVEKREEEWPDLLDRDPVSPAGDGDLESVVITGEKP